MARDGWPAAPATAPTTDRADATSGQRERRGRDQHPHHRSDLGRRATVAVDQRQRAEADGLLGAEPRRDHPGRRRDWQQVRAALERLADHHRGDRQRPHERLGRLQTRDLGRQEREGR